MKKIILCLASIFLIAVNVLYAAESEPNDTKATANTLTLNASNTGTINPSTDIDWWKVHTISDGQLSATLTISNGVYGYVQIYDLNGTTLLASNYTSGTITISYDGLAVGNYYIAVFSYNSADVNDKPAYTISNTLTLAPVANDVEPDGLYTQANVIPLNGSTTGHIGYYYNLVRDTLDWFKITTTGNGQLTITLTSNNGHYVYAQLFDGNGTTYLNGNYTSGTLVYPTDGLAAGTYYVKVFSYSNSDFASYTLSNSFTAPPVANDVEPNNTKASAKVINLNKSKTGQIGYYYNGVRDTLDWWKFTTTGDGLVKLQFTSNNGHYIYWQLYDNNGTTNLNSSYTSGTASYNTDGLAAGTYYIKIFCYSVGDFGSYTITDSLFNAPVANDAEPNGTIAQAVPFPVNTLVTGHSGYYYNLVRDTIDWYKITTTTDGMIGLTFTSNNSHFVYWQLFDNDGITALNSSYTSGTSSYNTDGLAAGTYYVKIFCYSVGDFAPYTLTNTLGTYANANDGLTNDIAKKAATLPANLPKPGHVGFRFNGGSRDMLDWWKINYTGSSGNLTVSMNFEAHLTGGIPFMYLQVYKDTAAAPIASTFSSGGNITFNLTALTQQYYYVKVFMYTPTDFDGYNLTATFTQTNKAKIVLQTATTGTDCNNGSLSYKCSASHSPYTVQLYRYGLKYGNAMIVNNTAIFTIGSLPPGNYYATVYGDGATGNAKGTSMTSTIVPVPANAHTTMIKKNKATLNWDSLTCIKYDSIYYRVQGNLTWTKMKTATNIGTQILIGLTPSTTYEWQVAHVDTGNLQTATSSYTGIVTFTTLALKVGEDEDMFLTNTVSLYPNPASSATSLHVTNADTQISFRLFDATGRCLQSETLQSDNGEYLREINLSGFAAGIYYIHLSSGSMDKTIKFSKE